MFKRIIPRAALDGFLHALILMLMIEVAVSPWAMQVSVDASMLAAVVLGVLSAGIYVLLLRRVQESRHIAWITLLSVLFCLLTLAGGVVWTAAIPFQLLPVREGNAGDGLLLLLMTAAYLLVAGFLRVAAWVIMAERCWKRKLAIK